MSGIIKPSAEREWPVAPKVRVRITDTIVKNPNLGKQFTPKAPQYTTADSTRAQQKKSADRLNKPKS